MTTQTIQPIRGSSEGNNILDTPGDPCEDSLNSGSSHAALLPPWVREPETAPPEQDFFGRMVEILLPDGKGLLMAVEAYFDESEREGGTFVVAGFGFFPGRAKRFSRRWKNMLGSIKVFHMADLVALQGEFASFTRADCNNMIKRAAAIVASEMEVAIAFSFSRAEFRSMAGSLRGLREPYSFCCYLCMQAMGHWITDKGIGSRIAYIFEAGHEFQAEANELMQLAAAIPAVGDLYAYRSHTFMDKRDAYPLQAADFLAWEWSKHRDETINKRIRPPRQSLIALLGNRPERQRLRHLSGETLRSIYQPFNNALRNAVDKALAQKEEKA